MKKIIFTVFLLFGFLYSKSSNNLELGIVLGNPTGLNGSYSFGGESLDITLGWWKYGADFNLSYLFHNRTDIRFGNSNLACYYGPRLRLGTREYESEENNTTLGIHINLGANYIFNNTPLNLFAEIAPGIVLVPKTGIDICGGIGIRYILGKSFRSSKRKKKKPKGVDVPW